MFNRTMRGVRPTDYVLAGLLVAAAVFIAIENIVGLSESLAHPLTTQTPLLIPVFVAAVLPILWRRQAVLPALGVTFIVFALSLPAFGWVTRCGFGLPLMFAFTYAIARFAGSWQRQVAGLLGVVATLAVIVVWDSSTGGFAGGITGAFPIALALCAISFAAGKIVNAASRRSGATGPATPTLEHAM